MAAPPGPTLALEHDPLKMTIALLLLVLVFFCFRGCARSEACEGVLPLIMLMPGAVAGAWLLALVTATLVDLGLPSWLDSLLQPGVGNGVFITLKASLVLLICVLLVMCCYIDDPDVAFHLKVFTSMAVILLAIVVWFINEFGAQLRSGGNVGNTKRD
ncbi:hypothetical protein EMIHUDRAFT_459411 [Emiliania huxleyi CCMP1516]|uniref:Uncharacterized protein n=2 Tax=Emiliania huxleyi TaxID=2903 RepID=A0A0D3IUQ4_EMIH1|nr:hypothetical protein EMIHUDRAFT_459411 [Emiliania huxleyi CCMP1516]EOD14989.1 hypothetical protein EMIHUDRAFT_459411 [Emiliania huxleyi CCMP1516]|eukprot:XP_005767418.1 hypothetical protein EMIHUDRAFT_459411 [Emiliania huxleyi CCMP1516]